MSTSAPWKEYPGGLRQSVPPGPRGTRHPDRSSLAPVRAWSEDQLLAGMSRGRTQKREGTGQSALGCPWWPCPAPESAEQPLRSPLQRFQATEQKWTEIWAASFK